MDRGPLYRWLAKRYGWDANVVGAMTPGQLLMYCGEDARREDEEEARSLGAGPGARIDPRTGHRLVRVRTAQEALTLLAAVRKAGGDAG